MQNSQSSIDSAQVLEALGHLSEKDYQEILQEIDPVAWVEYNRVLKGESFSFEGRNYLLQPYRDEHPNLIFYKGRQVEMSEFSMNWLFRKLWQNPYTAGLHTFPRDKQCLRFSKQRIEPAIEDSVRLDDWKSAKESDKRMLKFVKPPDMKGLKPYNFYVLGGTWESRKDSAGDAARGLTIDFIVYDERQDHPNDVESVVGEAMSHSSYKQSLTLGTPKLPGTQFDLQWESSDKNFWNVTCKKCGKVSPITMDNILRVDEHPETGLDPDTQDYYYGCDECATELDRQNGEWVATNPQRRLQYRGYHINQLMVCWITADEIMAKKNSPNYPTRKFMNEVLGFAYGGDDIPITIQMMYACAENDDKLGDSDGKIYVGIDWGHTSYMVIQNKTKNGHRLVDLHTVTDKDPRKHPKKFAEILKRYGKQVKRVVCDAGPDITYSYNLKDALLAESIRAEVWACYYATPPAKTNIQWNEKENCVTVGRSEFIEMAADEIANRYFIIPGQHKGLEKVETFMDHCCAMAAERSTTTSGTEFILYVNTGPDHFLHAKLYSDVASSEEVGDAVGTSAPPIAKNREISIATKNAGLASNPYDRLKPNRARKSVQGSFVNFNKRERGR